MDVPVSVKTQYRDNSIHKNLSLYFPDLDLTVGNDQIHQESLRLDESLLESMRIEFVGCIASSFRVKVNNVREDLKGQRMIATIWTDDTVANPIQLFDGIVDSAKMESNKRNKEIIAYDILYSKGDIDVASWYNNLSFPITIKNFRDSLFTYLDIPQQITTLKNDNVTITKQYEPNQLQAILVLKSICQLNATFGIINRQGIFEYRTPAWNIINVPYPSVTLFPATNLFPGSVETMGGGSVDSGSEVEAEEFAFYRTVNFEEFSVKPVDKVTIRQNEDDAGITYGSGDNNYIVQNNMFTRGLDNSVLSTIARNIYQNVSGIEFIPFTSENNGLPWLECGIDAVSYMVYNYDYDPNRRSASNENTEFIRKNFYVLNRSMSGIQALKDSYNAEGEEYQSEFITDLNANIETIKEQQTDTYTKEEIDYDFGQFDMRLDGFGDDLDGFGTELDGFGQDLDDLRDDMPILEKVTTLPSPAEQRAHPNTWYFLVRSSS